MKKSLALALCATLLAGCGSAATADQTTSESVAADSTSEATADQTTSESVAVSSTSEATEKVVATSETEEPEISTDQVEWIRFGEWKENEELTEIVRSEYGEMHADSTAYVTTLTSNYIDDLVVFVNQIYPDGTVRQIPIALSGGSATVEAYVFEGESPEDTMSVGGYVIPEESLVAEIPFSEIFTYTSHEYSEAFGEAYGVNGVATYSTEPLNTYLTENNIDSDSVNGFLIAEAYDRREGADTKKTLSMIGIGSALGGITEARYYYQHSDSVDDEEAPDLEIVDKYFVEMRTDVPEGESQFVGFIPYEEPAESTEQVEWIRFADDWKTDEKMTEFTEAAGEQFGGWDFYTGSIISNYTGDLVVLVNNKPEDGQMSVYPVFLRDGKGVTNTSIRSEETLEEALEIVGYIIPEESLTAEIPFSDMFEYVENSYDFVTDAVEAAATYSTAPLADYLTENNIEAEIVNGYLISEAYDRREGADTEKMVSLHNFESGKTYNDQALYYYHHSDSVSEEETPDLEIVDLYFIKINLDIEDPNNNFLEAYEGAVAYTEE